MHTHNAPNNLQDLGSELLGYQLTLFADNGMMEHLRLPITPDGFYRFSHLDEYRVINIEGRGNGWVACCNRPAFFKDVPPEYYRETPVEDRSVLFIESNDNDYYLYSEVLTRENTVFQNYPVHSEVSITIGSSRENDIYCDHPYISGKHAVLSRQSGIWQIQDCGSRYGIYVNQHKIHNATLEMGDHIFIMGLQILIGSNFISINSGGNRATVNSRILRHQEVRRSGYLRYSGQDLPVQPEIYFNRAPRKRMELEENLITVEAPPLSMERTQMPLMLRMGSSMVMSGKAAMSGNYTTLLTSLLFPFLSSKYTEKQRQEYESRRNTKYKEYLEMKRREIVNACREEEQLLNQKYPAYSSMVEQAKQKKRLWERRPIDDDFMMLRLGSGESPLNTSIDYPVRHFELEPDALEEMMYDLVEQKYILQNVPIMTSFLHDYVCGIQGSPDLVMELLQQLIIQTALYHSCDEVKTIFLLNPAQLQQLDFIRYIPHAWDDQKNTRFIATTESEAFLLGEYIKDLLPAELDRERELSQILKKRPFYMIFALDKKLFDSVEILKTVLQTGQNHGIGVLAAYNDLPKECHKIISLASCGKHHVISLQQNGGLDVDFSMDYSGSAPAADTMKMLANLKIRSTAMAQELPKMVTFLEMFQAGRVEHLNPLKRWRENNPVKSLSTPIGVAPDGSLFTLDLHEKHQGPHGLVAGMTGSGKSEFIVTYILSMAINYHPDEVAFILIDYKGGGLAGAFENPQTGLRLPHLVGTITNLDGAAIQRSLMSIESELMRRQRIFNEVKSATNEGSMDIYTYQKFYRSGKVSKPMPHLFIISDEFAELKKQQPEFMEKLISAARIGRSLGVHLILATQKPAGVVNDQIRSNTKFRVCLRVQDRADSMDMLKRPEAAELTDTGRFYLQVGYNEFFALGQSAWCGAAYEPQDAVQVQRDDAVEFLDLTGQIITKARPKVRKVSSGTKQLVAIVQHLYDLAKREGYTPKMLWEEPLPNELVLADLYARFPLPPHRPIQTMLGIIDDPQRQSQYPMILNLQNSHNMLIVGENGSGKSTLLQSTLYSLADRYSPEEVNFYILDFSNKLLSSFKNLPHCGAYLTTEDEGEFERFFDFISKEVARRKKLFEQADANSYENYIQQHPLPLVLVIIDNMVGFTGSKIGTNIAYKLHENLREGAGYGIQYIITSNFTNEVNAKSRQELGSRIALRAKDRFAYSEILGKKTTYAPPENPGRGMCVADDRPLEFQGAVVDLNGSAVERNKRIRDQLLTIAERFQNYTPAPKMATLDPEQTYEAFAAPFKAGRIPLGYAVKDVAPIALPLKQMYCLSLYFGNAQGIAPVLHNLLYACGKENMELLIIKKTTGSLFDSKIPCSGNIRFLNCTQEDSKSLLTLLIQQTQARTPFRAEYCQKNKIDRTSPEAPALASDYVRSKTQGLLVLFESFLDFCQNSHPDCEKTLFKFFLNGRGLNYYFAACFYPDDAKKILANPSMKSFNQDKLVMLFGGQFNRQDLISLPYEYKSITAESKQYNNFLLHYQNKIHPMQMPCGPLEDKFQDEDSAPIL